MSKRDRALLAALLVLCAVLVVAPVLTLRGAEFGGSDDAGSEKVSEITGEAYEPWATPVVERLFGGEIPGELESLLFCVQTGVGVGHKEFPRPNVLRACWGSRGEAGETIYELQCDVDDMTAEAVAFACERIFEAGALDVSTQPLGMKKSRPGTLLRALCREERRAAVTEALFRHTTTLGVREAALTRYTLERTVETVETALGPVRKKISRGFGVTREKWEYEDLAALAREKGLSLAEVRARL